MTEETTQIVSLNSLRGSRKKAYACLIVISGTAVGQMFRIEEDEMTIGRSHANTVPLLEEGVSRSHCRLINLPGGEVMLEDLNSTNGTYVNSDKISRRLLQDGDKIQVGQTTILKFTYHDKIEEEFQKQMFESALRDGLTKAYNKRYFLERLESEFSYAVRHKFPLTLVIMDLDHFKTFNDTWGHLCGDAVLVELSKRIHRSIRSEDVFARYGGEEFALIARGIAHDNGMILAERMRIAISDYPFPWEDKPLKVTMSLGVSSIPYHNILTTREMIEWADRALYSAKNAGRDQVQTL
ncbi:GGDEF domain-containing protein [Myxococcota bacterium]|nr:GGDEF domain-containing protein [Myxococcota bacterium]MBU1382646.1 GGDEF domain-containing protein [Myxococcota bacterium]MBU1495863.1 GGDEF domain-containing protein [Myxococcota bacterium]